MRNQCLTSAKELCVGRKGDLTRATKPHTPSIYKRGCIRKSVSILIVSDLDSVRAITCGSLIIDNKPILTSFLYRFQSGINRFVVSATSASFICQSLFQIQNPSHRVAHYAPSWWPWHALNDAIDQLADHVARGTLCVTVCNRMLHMHMWMREAVKQNNCRQRAPASWLSWSCFVLFSHVVDD